MKFGSVKILIPFLESEKQVINTFDDIRWSVFGLVTPFLEEIISEKIVVLSSTFVTSKWMSWSVNFLTYVIRPCVHGFRGDDFRKDYSRLAMMCAAFPSAPVLALTATASYKDISIIKESLNLKKPLEVIASPNRANLFYEKVFREGEDIDFIVKTLEPIAAELKEKK